MPTARSPIRRRLTTSAPTRSLTSLPTVASRATRPPSRSPSPKPPRWRDNDTYTVPDDPTLDTLQASVLLNDTDADGDSLDTAAIIGAGPATARSPGVPTARSSTSRAPDTRVRIRSSMRPGTASSSAAITPPSRSTSATSRRRCRLPRIPSPTSPRPSRPIPACSPRPPIPTGTT